MAIEVRVRNFRVLRDVHIVDPRKVSVFVGNNEQGKTSLVSSLKWTLGLEVYGLKGKTDNNELMTYGETRMDCEFTIGKHTFARSRTGGASIKSIAERLGTLPDLLPLIFDAKMNGDGGNKHMKAFLSGAAEAKFDPAVQFADVAAVKSCITTAQNAGRMKTKEIIKYCEEQRAASKAPSQPPMPTVGEPQVGAIELAKKTTEATRARVAEVQKDLDDFVKLNRGFILVQEYLTAQERYNVDLAASSKGDPLKDKRQAYNRLIQVPDHTTLAVADLLHAAGYDAESAVFTEAVSNLRAAQGDAKRRLAENPAPPSTPVPPVLPDDAQLAYQELKTVDKLNAAGVKEAMGQSINYSTLLRNQLAEAQGAHTRAMAQHDELMRSQGAWAAYREAVPRWEEQKAQANVEWSRWDYAAKAIMEAETDHINKAGLSFGALVAQLSSVMLGGRQVRITMEEGIFLGKDPILQCSDSTRWRMEIAIMAAVGITLKSPLLLIDGADILDPVNTNAMSTFLNDHVIQHFEHVIVTRTPRGLMSEEFQAGGEMTKWLVQNGVVTKAPSKSLIA